MKRILHSGEGAVLVEMAIFLAGFSYLLIALVNFATAINASLQLENALRAGMQVAINITGIPPTLSPSDIKNIDYTVRHASLLPASDVSATAATFCECDSTEIVCGSSCKGIKATFIKIGAAYNVPLFISSAFMPNPYPLNKAIAVRIQ